MGFLEEFIAGHPPRQVTVNGKTFEYLTGGSGETAFLVFPGAGQNALSCYDLIDAFENKYKVVAINISGLAGLEEFFEYVDQILKKEKVKNIIIYGLSLGGLLTQHYLRRHRDLISRVIISHSGSTKSPTIIKKVIIPGKILHFFLPILPLNLLQYLSVKFVGRFQVGKANILSLYQKYSTPENLERRREYLKELSYSFWNREFLESFYKIGMDLREAEKNFSADDFKNWRGKILILKTDNDPLAKDEGMLKKLYPQAKVYIFHETGHLTPFIQFENMVKVIKNFLEN
ncbi:alpha/beta fold hydrolase [Candidatus Microgenomates bacterium]|nr:alpha/beta fold hydrolase [Candidatus Microgenomates bacterium]